MSEPSIIVTRRWPAAVEQELCARHPSVRLNTDDEPLGADGLRAALREADVVLCTITDRLDADVFAGGVRARLLAQFGVGYNNIDVAAAREAGLVVTNTPGVLTDATADIALMLMLMAARRAGEGEREVRAGAWTGWRPTHLLGTGLTGKTVGILGMGRIGSAVARRAHFGFGMPVVFYNPDQVPADQHGIPEARQLDTIEDVLATADFVSLHMPGGPETAKLINAERLKAMKSTAFLVNTARGEIVDTDALVTALTDGTIAGAGLDVYEGEPAIPEALRQLPNAVLLPHLGSATEETRTAMGMTALENLEAFLAGKEPPCKVS